MTTTLEKVRDDTFKRLKAEASQVGQVAPSDPAERELTEFLLPFRDAEQAWLRGRDRDALELFEQASTKLPQDRGDRGYLRLLPSHISPSQLARHWGIAGALYALLEGFVPRRLEPAELGVKHFIKAKRFAHRAGLQEVAEELADFVETGIEAEAGEKLSPEEKEALEELKTAIRLLSIEDPFEGWRALAKEVSKHWPAGLSAVDAIREERGRYSD